MKDVDYRGLSTELDGLLDKLQTADLDIDEAVKCYERGMEIVKQLESYLASAENQVKKVKASFEA